MFDGIYYFNMSQLRQSNGFYIKAYNIPNNTAKTVYFNQLKYRFPSIKLTHYIKNYILVNY